MTIDAGLKPEGARGALPHSWRRRPSGVDAGPKRYSVQRKLAVVARLWGASRLSETSGCGN